MGAICIALKFGADGDEGEKIEIPLQKERILIAFH